MKENDLTVKLRANKSKKFADTKDAQMLKKSAKKNISKASSSKDIREAADNSVKARKKLLLANRAIKQATKR